MRFSAFIYLLLPYFILANQVDQTVLGDLRAFKLFESTPTASPELSPIETQVTKMITQEHVWSASPITWVMSSFANPGEGGGATCVQTCLARAASQVGCGGSANFRCVCKKGGYVGKSWDCFGQSGCPADAIGRALADLNVACQPYRRLASSIDESPESPVITPEGTPIVASFESSKHDEL
ncbi:hypothetical protein OPQ81_011008 [Rhizoctonia solani]|nr:hypothetical protein OPQ81_011008 [Rhizoctonia solani]